jgi:hypothetical protein
MPRSVLPSALFVVAMALAGSARADFVSVLQATPIAASTAAAFHDSNVTVGTLSPDGAYNFLDQWKFEVRGKVAEPGSYSGSLIAQPLQVVPLPAAATLFASGFASLMLMAYRQRRR